MRIGTRSLLFGVHQFLWHPLTVGLAWKKIYRRWPTREEWLAIFCHDAGYWGCPNIDGQEGRLHPERGAQIGIRIAIALGWDWPRVQALILGHSREYAKRHGAEISDLCWPDKYSIFFEPRWFYLLRSTLSGELDEFQENATKSGHLPPNHTRREWFDNYKQRVRKTITNKFNEKNLCSLGVGERASS